MARCEECLHFEVCEALEQGNGLMKVSPIHCGYYKNAADVVPRSNVDYARQCGYESGIRTGARKVFDAVDELIKDYAHNHLDATELVVRLYLIKKKYTEEKK